MRQHPFLKESNNLIGLLPSQNAPLSVKNTDKWKEECMDALESIGRQQYLDKQKLLDNYRLRNGEYVDGSVEEETKFNVLSQIQEDLEIPDFIQPYDIIGQPMARLEGQMDSFPDVFNVKGQGDLFESEKLRVKTKLLHEYFEFKMNQSINLALQEMQEEDPDWESISPEEQQAKQEQVVSKMTPPEIQKYMDVDYKHILELWGQKELKDQFERFKLKQCRRVEFAHYLTAAQRYRHLYTGPKGLKVESLNSVYAFGSKSPNTEYVQDGDYAGYVQILSIPSIIDRFGHLMTDKQINDLQSPYEKPNKDKNEGRFLSGKKVGYLDPHGLPYGSTVATLDANVNRMLEEGGIGYTPYMFASKEELSKIDGTGGFNGGHQMMVVVTAYWKSQKRVGKLTWINPELGIEEVLLVDETFVVPSYIKQIKNEKFDVNAGLNTLIWTRETEVWQGIKINNYNDSPDNGGAIYLDVKPAEIQIGKLLIGGQFANNLNTTPTSLVDKIKPYAWFHTILWNQARHFIETEILPFALFTSGMIPNDKDYGGEDGLPKWITIAQAAGIGVVEDGVNNLGQNAGGQFPRIVDLDRGQRILVRLQLAAQVKALALELIGISPQYMGDVKASETATGIQAAQSNSSIVTSVWYTTFFECEKELLQMQLDAAKYLQARGKQIDTVGKSELSLEALRLALEDGDLYDLHIYVTDSQEELRNIQLAKQLALENNTSEMSMSDRLLLSTGTSLNEIVTGLKASEKEAIARSQQQIQLQQQQLEQQGMDAEEARNLALQMKKMELDNQLKVATINALGRQQTGDGDGDGINDILSYNKIAMTGQAQENQYNLASDKIQLEKQKENNKQSLEDKKIRQQDKKMSTDFILQKMKIDQARIQGDKSK